MSGACPPEFGPRSIANRDLYGYFSYTEGKKCEENRKVRKILELISTQDGQWGWYQLDRALSLLNHLSIREGTLMSLLKELEEKDLIQTRQITGSTQSRYMLTEKGKEFLVGEEYRALKQEVQSAVSQLQTFDNL
jgi:DNA-binding PadR family transcriptional regulator